MNPKVKLGAYAVLLILAAWFGLAFRSNYLKVTAASDADTSESAPATTTPPATNSETPASAASNTTAQTTNTTTDTSNGPVAATNAAPAPIARASKPAPTKPAAPVDISAAKGAMITYLAGFIAAIIGVGILIAIELSQYIGAKAMDYLFLDIGDAMRDPLYERAEAEWANGAFLEAIETLREYLKQNPREIHASLRIAEIYEKDLRNYLAAALEYEEVLKHRLPPDRWGWSAIHLCNLYSKLNHHDKTRSLLQRIVDEYPKTAAAKKARTRLGLAEPEAEDEAATEESVETSQTTAAPQAPVAAYEPEAPPPEPEPPKPSLPPGFRPKK